MKKYLIIAAVLLSAIFASAQSNKEEVDLMQAAFGMDKKEAVTEFVKLSDTQKDAFWKLYDEYETERKELGKVRIELLNQYAQQYKTFTSEQADAWTTKVMDLQTKTDDLIKTYYSKVKKATDGIVATQFYQIENYILTEIRMEVLDEIPFVNEKK
jgi:hypothetical protein